MAGTHAVQAADYVAVERVPADERNGVRIGYLDCRVGGGVGYVLGSAKEVECTFQSTVGSKRTEVYAGAIRKMGVDLGFTTESRIVWAVFAPTAGYHTGSLSGIYQGATAEATVGVGVGANVLIGGTAGSIHLQTISVSGQVGLNIAATGTSMTLAAVN
nr:DUF992 domain-containing protein [Limoniibacter endophyticus]